jgi:glycosyltransferase involved in cell wall biosynthesis
MGQAVVVLFPDRSEDNKIGGLGAAQRLARIARAMPHLAAMAGRLHKSIKEVKPRAIWVNSEKALFVASLAVPRRLPIAVMVRTEMQHIRPYCALAWRRADAVIAVSGQTLSQLCSTGHAPAGQYVVHDGIDADATLERSKSEPANLPRSAPNSFCLAFPATLAGPLKGHETGIRAVAKLIHSGVKTDLWLCGDVPSGISPEFSHRMRQLAGELAISQHVHFVGYRNDIEAVMARSDIVLLPSYTEGLPRSLMEAMALGKPVVATNVGGIPELVRDGIDGILINAGEVDALVHALRVLCDPDVRQKMGHEGQRRVRERFSLCRQASEFVGIMDALAQDRTGKRS